jgi:hypothetical protein
VIGERFTVIGRHAHLATPSQFLLADVNRSPITDHASPSLISSPF